MSGLREAGGWNNVMNDGSSDIVSATLFILLSLYDSLEIRTNTLVLDWNTVCFIVVGSCQ